MVDVLASTHLAMRMHAAMLPTDRLQQPRCNVVDPETFVACAHASHRNNRPGATNGLRTIAPAVPL
eukprot:364794-Chlamydomonas_euryale.AAC.5